MGLERLRFKTIIAILAVKAVLTENHEPVAGSPHTARPPPASKHAAAISAALVPYCRAARSSRRARVRQRGAGKWERDLALEVLQPPMRHRDKWQRVGWRRHERFALERRPGEQIHQHALPLAVAVERRRLPRT